ncbi:MAG: hypothetical protein AB7U83_03285 [Vicinamibacterales bacterium]
MSTRRRLACAAAVVVAAAACGKKGPPLAPLVRVPAQITAFAAERADDTVFVTLTVPATNVGGDAPGDVGAVEVYAATAERQPTVGEEEPGAPWTLVQRVAVRRPVPPLPPPPPGTPPPPLPPLEPGAEQGQVVTIGEALTADRLAPVETARDGRADADADAHPTDESEHPALSLPAVAPPADRTARRFYVARAVSRRGRPGQWSSVREVATASPLGPPRPSEPTYDADAITFAWQPPPGAAEPPAPPPEGLLPSRPFGAAVTPTRYNVYAPAADPAPDPLGLVNRPVPLNAAALEAPGFRLAGVAFGQERCVVVRAITTVGDAAIEGPASPPMCITPQDTFPPPVPTALEAVGGSGVISLIWEPVDAADLAGYLVFRGENGGEPATALTPSPIRDASFDDRTVTPGVRYGYVVVAVDSASPANRSAPSNRAEETARQ